MKFQLKSKFQPTGDQPQAIEKLLKGLDQGYHDQVLLGVTGSGKSVVGETQVIVKNSTGTISIKSIGDFIDEIFIKFPKEKKVIGESEVVFIKDLPPKYRIKTYSFNPDSKETGWANIIQLSRHHPTNSLHKVTTACGRIVKVTPDHNFYALKGGELKLSETTSLKIGDYLPIPLSLQFEGKNIEYINLIDNLSDNKKYYFSLPYFSQRWNSNKLKLKNLLNSVKIHNILYEKERVPLNIYKKLIAADPKLAKGSLIGVKGIDYQFPLKIKITKRLSRFLGYYIAEGHADSKYFIISSSDKEISGDFIAFLDEMKLNYHLRSGTCDYQISSCFWSELLKNLCGGLAKNKRLPDFWPRLSRNNLAELLKAYFSADGGVDGLTVSATTASEKFAIDLSLALLKFGIIARIRKRLIKIPNTKRRGEYWTMTISGKKYLEIFQKEINFVLPVKRDKLKNIIKDDHNTNVDVIPIQGAWLKLTLLKLGINQLILAKSAGISRSLISMIESDKRKPSRELFEKIIEILIKEAKKRGRADMTLDLKEKKSLLNLYWSRIKEISLVENEDYVYDFAVESNETFLTGSGIFVHNTFTMANIVAQVKKPTLVISHNKTLAAQLASEFKEFFPETAVCYFVSYYDYYQPEAYIPQSDTYIEKETDINEEIDRLRHLTTSALLTRRDVIIVASVSCIYGLGSVEDYSQMKINIKRGETTKRQKLLRRLTDLQYQRNDLDFHRGSFRVKGSILEIFPIEAEDYFFRLDYNGDQVEKIQKIKYLTAEPLAANLSEITIFPAKHFVTPEEKLKLSLKNIKQELAIRVRELKKQNKLLEAQRLEERTNYDLEMIQEIGYCNGIENYSRYLTFREAGEPPATLLDYFPDDFLMFIDESHMTIPQIRGMYNGDRARKQTLVDFGFRLPSALDNRPLKFSEFRKHQQQTVYVSATPAAYEFSLAGVKIKKAVLNNLKKEIVDHKDLELNIKNPQSAVAQQVIRPTGLLDPEIEVKKTDNQVNDLIKQIENRTQKGQRVLVTTLTKRLAEDLADHLAEKNIKAAYLHSEINTLERVTILRGLRQGEFDVLVGINLLREGLDLPEVSLVAILDADKEGFLRSETSLIQVMGRAARHSEGKVIMYADNITRSMKRAIEETKRRRMIQQAFNKKHNITPQTIVKEIKDSELFKEAIVDKKLDKLQKINIKKISQNEFKRIIEDLEDQMEIAAKNLEFEKAAFLRDEIKKLKQVKK